MWIKGACSAILCISCCISTAQAQAETPLSAIDWLSDSLDAPVVHAKPAQTDNSISDNALPEDVSVLPLGMPTPDAVGLLPVSVTGLPADLWGTSTSSEIARRIQDEQLDMLPAMQDLLLTILMAELDPPSDSDSQSILFLARIDTLLRLGALEPALALMERAGVDNPEVFRRYFDAALLIGSEDQACAKLRATPALSPTYPTRIFCLARGGNWTTASLTLETAMALGFVSDTDADLLLRFLDPSLADQMPPFAAPPRPSPLVFRMMEAIGEALPTSAMPLAFANADTHTNAGWKSQIEAAERLARSRAISPNQLIEFYTARKPAASGGVWDRVDAVQKFETALSRNDIAGLSAATPLAWSEIKSAELEVPFAEFYANRLSGVAGIQALPSVVEIGLLSGTYEKTADAMPTDSARNLFLKGIATGQPTTAPSNDRTAEAVGAGFSSTGIPVRLQSLTNDGRLGEAILRAMTLFTDGSRGDYDELSDALTFFRSVGLEDTARRASLQLLLLERRG